MLLDFAALDATESYRWLSSTVTPRPIAWVTTLSAEGEPNLAPFSFFQVICDQPPVLMVNVGLNRHGQPKDTACNAIATGELVIQLVGASQAEAMSATSASLEHGVSEFVHAGLTHVPSTRVKPPRVAGAAVAFECELVEVKPYPAENARQFLLFARVLLAHIDDAVLTDPRHVDPAKLDLIGRLSGSQYTTTRDRFVMRRPD